MTPRAPAGPWARLLAIAGTIILVIAAGIDPRWVDHPIASGIMAIAAALFRMRSVSITKFASLNAVQVVAMTGALAVGATATAIAVYAGVLVADVWFHRKPFTAAWINASREMVTLYAAYGVYAVVAIRIPDAVAGRLSTEAVPAIAVGAAVASVALGLALRWAWSLAEGGVLGPVDYLAERYGALALLLPVMAGAVAAVRAR